MSALLEQRLAKLLGISIDDDHDYVSIEVSLHIYVV